MVEIRNLTKTYGKYRALNNLNLHIDKGEIFGFVGPNGAGKQQLCELSAVCFRQTGERYT